MKKSIIEGLEKLKKSFLDVLIREGVKPIEAVGQMFDPMRHHAVLSEEVEGKEEGEILEELQPGYEYGDRVIRASMVKVAK